MWWFFWIGIIVLVVWSVVCFERFKTISGKDRTLWWISLAVIDALALVAIIIGVIMLVSSASSFVSQAKAAAKAQGLRAYSIDWGNGIELVGNGCTVNADLHNGTLVLRDVKPVLVLTPRALGAICASPLAK